MKRGNVVLVNFPYTDGRASKIRPSLVIQNDRDNVRLQNTIIALITGNISRVHEQTQLLVDPGIPEGAKSGLHGPSAILGSHLYTVRQPLVIDTIGNLPDDVMQQFDDCLKAALEL